ncbi:MAG: hypothetical protein ACI92S_005481, partial [Planctomycetaceae bacterium]
ERPYVKLNLRELLTSVDETQTATRASAERN